MSADPISPVTGRYDPSAKRDLSGVTLRWEDPDSDSSIRLRRAYKDSLIEQDPSCLAYYRERGWADILPADSYRADNACWAVAYDTEAVPIAVAGAKVFGHDIYMGYGFVVPEYRGSGLIQELGYLRWRWGMHRGATRSIFGCRTALIAVVRMAIKFGYEEMTPSGTEPWYTDYAQRWFEKPITQEDISKAQLAPPH